MKILNHKLHYANGQMVAQKPTTNKGGSLRPSYLLMHFTAVTRGQGTIDWFAKPQAQASAHLLIDRDGSITQFVDFNVVAWHAGVSRWNGLMGLNAHSIGIELVNGGRLGRSNGQWFCPVDKRLVPPEQVIMAKHKHEHSVCGWQSYSEDQLEAAMEVGALLVQEYGLVDVLGHDDVSPFRKNDPGPAFPMGSFRSRIMGRHNEGLDYYQTATAVNIRKGPGTQYDMVTDPLPPNTVVTELRREGNWSFVEVMKPVHGINDAEGWVATKYLHK